MEPQKDPNFIEQDQEIEALESIYPESFQLINKVRILPIVNPKTSNNNQKVNQSKNQKEDLTSISEEGFQYQKKKRTKKNRNGKDVEAKNKETTNSNNKNTSNNNSSTNSANNGTGIKFRLTLVPHVEDLENNHSSVALNVTFPLDYPSKSSPIIQVEKIKGLSDKETQELQTLLETKSKELIGRVSIFELTQIAVEYLQAHNRTTISFYDQMMRRQKTPVKALNENAEEEEEQDESNSDFFPQKKIFETLNAPKDKKKANLFSKKGKKNHSELDDLVQAELERQSLLRQSSSSIEDSKQEEQNGAFFEEDEAEILLKDTSYAPHLLPPTPVSPVLSHAHSPSTFHIKWKRDSDLETRDALGVSFSALNLETRKLMNVREITYLFSTEIKEKLVGIIREIEKLKLLRHEYIVGYLGAELQEQTTSITFRVFQEYVINQSITSVRMDERIMRKYAQRILKGLQYLHKNHVAHKSLNVSNLILDNELSVKLTNFGVFKQLADLKEEDASRNLVNKNIHYYLPIDERDEDSKQDFENEKQEDIVSFGRTLVELTGGKGEKLPNSYSKEAKNFLNLCFSEKATIELLLSQSFITDVSTRIDCIPITPPHSGIGNNVFEDSRNTLESSSDSFSLGSTASNSRFKTDFEELEELGSGGFGVVVKAKNKLDGRLYAIKKIRMNVKELTKVVREVTTLSKLNHQYVVRYYQAWLEGGKDGLQTGNVSEDEDDWFISKSKNENQDYSEDSEEEDEEESFDSEEGTKTSKKRNTILYIQMEYCTKRTLRQVIDNGVLDEEERWRILRQIVEGLNHIHSQGIIHRDLKPANIFLDQKGDVKIGDFGLATTGSKIMVLSISSASLDENESTRPGVGTPFYTSPEQEKVGYHFDAKVDIYALGIIFFEMCCSFSTGMERILTLTSLRNEHKFPLDFRTKYFEESELIDKMLKPEPSERPDTNQLLSDYLPTRMEDNILKEALNVITRPNTTIFSTLMEKLFSIQPDITYDYYVGYNFVMMEHTLRSKLSSILTSVSKCHGAIPVDPPLLIPKNDLLKHMNICTLLDSSGTSLMLPYDLIQPFARFIARNKVNNLKRYSFSKVYRNTGVGGRPKELNEFDFDIVSPPSPSSILSVINEAEVIRVITEAMDAFSSYIGSYHIKVNHVKIFESILSICNVDEKFFPQIKSQLAKHPWTAVSNQLISQNYISQDSAKALSLYFIDLPKYEIEEALNKLELLLKKSKVREYFLELKYLLRHLKNFGVFHKVRLDLSLVFQNFYHSGIIFQTISDAEERVVAAGGRYDELIKKFLPPTSQITCGAVGVSFAVDKILSIIISRKSIKVPMSETEVLICSLGGRHLEEKMRLAVELWKLNIKAEYTHPDKTFDDLATICQATGISWMICLRDKKLSSGTVALRNVKGGEVELKISDVAEYLLQILNPRKPNILDSSELITPSKHHHEKPSNVNLSSNTSSTSTHHIDIKNIPSQYLKNPKVTSNNPATVNPELLIETIGSFVRNKSKLRILENSILPQVKKIMPWCRQIHVAATDLELAMVKEIYKDPAKFMETHPRSKQEIKELDTFFQRNNQSIIAIYSSVDKDSEFMILDK